MPSLRKSLDSPCWIRGSRMISLMGRPEGKERQWTSMIDERVVTKALHWQSQQHQRNRRKNVKFFIYVEHEKENCDSVKVFSEHIFFSYLAVLFKLIHRLNKISESVLQILKEQEMLWPQRKREEELGNELILFQVRSLLNSQYNFDRLVGNNSQRAFWRVVVEHNALIQIILFQIQTFPPFVTFVLPRIDLRLR